MKAPSSAIERSGLPGAAGTSNPAHVINVAGALSPISLNATAVSVWLPAAAKVMSVEDVCPAVRFSMHAAYSVPPLMNSLMPTLPVRGVVPSKQ